MDAPICSGVPLGELNCCKKHLQNTSSNDSTNARLVGDLLDAACHIMLTFSACTCTVAADCKINSLLVNSYNGGLWQAGNTLAMASDQRFQRS